MKRRVLMHSIDQERSRYKMKGKCMLDRKRLYLVAVAKSSNHRDCRRKLNVSTRGQQNQDILKRFFSAIYPGETSAHQYRCPCIDSCVDVTLPAMTLHIVCDEARSCFGQRSWPLTVDGMDGVSSLLHIHIGCASVFCTVRGCSLT